MIHPTEVVSIAQTEPMRIVAQLESIPLPLPQDHIPARLLTL